MGKKMGQEFLSSKKSNKQSQQNDMNRPKDHKGNKRTEERYESFDGEPIE